ncbi:hypothetical protein MMC13_005763 [Lambiella insularis]|nr:hypothetical protein [Lambiella insularis]
MTGLQILKLRHIQLKDENLEVLADAIGIRVRSLDIRDNKITDTGVRILLSKCFHPTRDIQTSQIGRSRVANRLNEEDWPSGVARPDLHLLNEFRGEDIDERFLRRLTQGVVDRLSSEDLPSTGLTHLYIANNAITIEAVASLLKSQNLHLLDAGTADTVKALGISRARTSFSQHSDYQISLPGAEKLAPVLEKYAKKNLRYLRVHHTVVTKPSVFREDMVSPLELPASSDNVTTAELDGANTSRYELEDTAPVYELAASGITTPRYELSGDMMRIVVSPSVGKAPTPNFEESHFFEVRRGSAFAPEVLEGPDTVEEENEPVVLSVTGLGNMAQTMNGIAGRSTDEEEVSPLPEQNEGYRSLVIDNTTEHNVAMIEQERRDLRSHHSETAQSLSPGALPMLRTIVLTDVPSMDKNQHVVKALKKFIADCATEHKLARMQASLEHSRLFVPGKPRSAHHLHRVRELFALKRIVLEMAPATMISTSSSNNPVSPRAADAQGWNSRANRSSTEDSDTAAFWAAQENDFSFFGDEECGLPATEPGMHFPLSTLSEKMVLPMESLAPGSLPTLQQSEKPDPACDVVQELAKFRRERKAVYEDALKLGKQYVEGYWPGEVKIIRDAGEKRNRSNVDWYGNNYEKGVYR